jgi:hypothetical protein
MIKAIVLVVGFDPLVVALLVDASVAEAPEMVTQWGTAPAYMADPAGGLRHLDRGARLRLPLSRYQ